MPTKGDLILLDMTDSGTPQEYRVLKNVSGAVYEVLSMTNSTDSQQFTSSGQTYENSDLDTHLNTTWYNGLSSTAKSAIVDKTFTQDSWYKNTSGNPDYEGYYVSWGTTYQYQVSLANASFGNEITRHCYVLSVQDIIDYLEVTPQMTTANTTLTSANIWTMFYNQDTRPSPDYYHWLRSAYPSSAYRVFYVVGNMGYLDYDAAYNSISVRPAFQIDLSKISFTIE